MATAIRRGISSMPGISLRLSSGLPLTGYHTLNVSTGTETSINELIESFEKAVGHAVPVDYKAARPGDILRSVLSNKALASLLSFVPPTDLPKGFAAPTSGTAVLLLSEGLALTGMVNHDTIN